MDNNHQSSMSKRTILIIVTLIDTVIGAILLLISSGFLLVDISSWGIPRWVIGVVGGILFVGTPSILFYQLTKTDVSE